LLRGKIISNIFSFRDHRTLKPSSKFILKNLFFVQFKTNGRKLGFNTPLSLFQGRGGNGKKSKNSKRPKHSTINISLYLLYLYYAWKSRWSTAPLATPMTPV